MNTTATGRRFEKKVRTFFDRELANGRLALNPKDCKVFSQKGYYSKDRGAEIVFDIAIEVTRPGGTSYSMLVLIECKHYSHSVPINDAEEFAEKIRQVAGAKGIIVSTGPFQRSTVNYCQSKHIGLVRHLRRKFDWILERTPFPDSQFVAHDILDGLLSNSHGNYHPDLYCCVGDTYTTSLGHLLHNLVSDADEVACILRPIEEPRRTPRRIVDFISKGEIERRSETVLEAIGYSSGQAPLDTICRWQSTEAGLSVRSEASPGEDDESTHATLGRIRFNPLEITIFEQQNTHPGRARFTLAHELGHHFLGHSEYMAGEYCEEDDFEVDELDESAGVGIADIRRMEWQANYFASCLLLPRRTLLPFFYKLASQYDLKNRGTGYIYLDHQPCNRRDFNLVANRLMLEYCVTRSTVRIRLQTLGLLTDARSV